MANRIMGKSNHRMFNATSSNKSVSGTTATTTSSISTASVTPSAASAASQESQGTQRKGGPKSTTRALLVSLTVPRFVATSKLLVEDGTIDTALIKQAKVKRMMKWMTGQSSTPGVPPQDATKLSFDGPAETTTTTTNTNRVSSSSTTTEAYPTKNEEKPRVVTFDPLMDHDKTKTPFGMMDPDQHNKRTTMASNYLTQHMTAFQHTPTLSTEEEEQKEEQARAPSVEEATHVIVSEQDSDESEINIEALLRLTLKTLLEEWHILTIPTYTCTDRQVAANPYTSDLNIEDSDGWLQVQFMVHATSLAVILDRMERIGVGTNCGSIGIFKAELCRTSSAYAQVTINEETELITNTNADGSTSTTRTKLQPNLEDDAALEESQHNIDSNLLMRERVIEAAKMEWRSAASRLRIEQVREQIAEQAALNFDYMALVIIASILAGVGLITNNSVVIVASMLVSPIMGPVLGLTFGSRIYDWPLLKQSLATEMLSLVGCMLVGVAISIGASFTSLASEEWPTNEMLIRGETMGLVVGIAIAIPSGMGVCLSVLGANTSSLVGVAISASLLPPAVNAGICFMHSILLATGAVGSDLRHSASEFAEIGIISLALTVLNIVCIWAAGLVMFEIKEVAPVKQKNAFWAKDIKVARELNKGQVKPPPVDLTIIQEGINAVLQKKGKDTSKEKIILKRGISKKGMTSRRTSFKTGLLHHESTSEKSGMSSGHTNDGDDGSQTLSMRNGNKTLTTGVSASSIVDTVSKKFPLSPSSSSLEPVPVEWTWSRLFGLSSGIDEPIVELNEGDEHEDDDNASEDGLVVGLEDMGMLLSFDDEDTDVDIDHAAVAKHIGTGRYI